MITSGAMRGATALRLARQHLSPSVVLDLSRGEVFGLLGAEPLSRFTTTVGALIDQALDDALASTPGEPTPTGPAADRPRRGSPVSPSGIESPAASASALTSRPRRLSAAPTRPAAVAVATRPALSRSTRHPAALGTRTAPDAPAFRPLVVTPSINRLPDVASVAANQDAAPTVAAADSVTVRSRDESPTSWTKRAAALGAATPVVVERVRPDQPHAPELRPGRQRSAPSAADQQHRRAARPRHDESEAGVRRPAHAEPAVLGKVEPVARPEPTGRSQLAGLARWWNETHGPTEPSPIDASVLPTTTPTPGATSTRRHPTSPRSFDTTGSDDLRSAFHGLLEEALLTEARANGIEVRP